MNASICSCNSSSEVNDAPVAQRRRLIQKRQNASFRRLTVDWLLACPRAIIQSSKPMIGKTMPPFADNARLNAYFLGDGVLGARQRASSTLHIFGLSRTSLASGIIPILNHESLQRKVGTRALRLGGVDASCSERGQ
jgi:hypothetical protein